MDKVRIKANLDFFSLDFNAHSKEVEVERNSITLKYGNRFGDTGEHCDSCARPGVVRCC